jgi:hypothetical protein
LDCCGANDAGVGVAVLLGSDADAADDAVSGMAVSGCEAESLSEETVSSGCGVHEAGKSGASACAATFIGVSVGTRVGDGLT